MNDLMNYETATISQNDKDIISTSTAKSFLEFLDVTPLTAKAYRTGITQFLSFLQCEGVKFPERQNVIDFKKSLQLSGHKTATIALYLSALRRFFDWCETEGLYKNITRGIKAPKQDKGHKRDFLSAESLRCVLAQPERNSLEGKRNFAVLALMATCGLRTVEVVRANVEDFRTLCGVNVLYIQGKGRNDKKEFVKLTAPVMNAIRDYLNARGKVNGNAPLFASCSRRNKGGRLTTRTISAICKSAMVNAGFDSPMLTAHSFRHSAVTIALMNGQTLAEVQFFARHSNIATTQIYAHNVDRLKSQCENVITSALFTWPVSNAYGA